MLIRILNLNLDSINGLRTIEPDFSDPVYLGKGICRVWMILKKNNTYNKSLSGFFLVP